MAINRSGGILYTGDLVVWTSDTVTLVTSATGTANMTLADDLSGDSGPWIIVSTLGSAATGTVVISGKSSDGAPASDTKTFTNLTTVRSRSFWTRIDSYGVTGSATTTTVAATAYSLGAIARASVADATSPTIAGMVVHGDAGPTDGVVDDDELCAIRLSGAPSQGLVYDSSVTIGQELEADGNGHLVGASGTDARAILGAALEPSTASGELLWVHLKP